MRLYYVDGHNLILSTGQLSDLHAYEGKRASRDEAESLILRWAERRGDVRVCLFYDGQDFQDGHPGNRDEGPLSVRFTDPPAEADDRIVFEASRESGAGEKVWVVTDDGGIRNRLKGSSVNFIDVEVYLRDLTARKRLPEKEGRFSDEERAALSLELQAHASSGSDREEETASGRSPAPGIRPGFSLKAPPRPKEASVVSRPGREARREAYRKRTEKRTASPLPTAARPKSRKKRRGY